MKIAVKLHGILRDYRPPEAKVDLFEITLAEPAVVRQAAEHFHIPLQKIHAVFVNDEEAGLETPLHHGDQVRLFPPVVGGSDRVSGEPYRVFIGGIMQGSRRENTIDAQDYRQQIGECLRQHMAQVEVVDPFQLHPDSITYSDEEARQTLITLARIAGQADAVIAFVPEASMGTALEIWEAYHHGRPVFAISPLTHNWVIKLATRIFPDIEQFCAFVATGEFERLLGAARRA
jgi:molybdopterin converting factor small subunit